MSGSGGDEGGEGGSDDEDQEDDGHSVTNSTSTDKKSRGALLPSSGGKIE